jgi:hypothetical protein
VSVAAEAIANYWESHATEATEKKSLFLEGLKEYGTVKHAAQFAQINRITAYQWRSVDPQFRQAWDAILEDVTDDVEASLYRQASSDKNVVATIFYLKNNRHKYRDRVTIDVVSTQREVEDRLSALANRLPSASTKDLISEALGLPRRNSSKASSEVVEVEVDRGSTASSSD